jgi:hypothetical protein
MKSDQRSTSMRTSYTDAGVAVDGCSTLIDTEVGMTSEFTTAAPPTLRFIPNTL